MFDKLSQRLAFFYQPVWLQTPEEPDIVAAFKKLARRDYFPSHATTHEIVGDENGSTVLVMADEYIFALSDKGADRIYKRVEQPSSQTLRNRVKSEGMLETGVVTMSKVETNYQNLTGSPLNWTTIDAVERALPYGLGEEIYYLKTVTGHIVRLRHNDHAIFSPVESRSDVARRPELKVEPPDVAATVVGRWEKTETAWHGITFEINERLGRPLLMTDIDGTGMRVREGRLFFLSIGDLAVFLSDEPTKLSHAVYRKPGKPAAKPVVQDDEEGD